MVSHCLEKDPAHRFQSARDLSFALRALAQGDTSSDAALAAPSPSRTPQRSRQWSTWLLAGAALLAVGATVAATALITRELGREPAPASWSAEQLSGPELP